VDEELKAQLIPILENTKDGLAAAVDFLCEQSPLLVNEILLWEGIKSGIICLVLLALMIIGIVISKKVRSLVKNKDCKKACGDSADECMWCPGLAIAYHVMVYIGLPIIMFCNLTWLKVLVAPRLFLVEYIKDWL